MIRFSLLFILLIKSTLSFSSKVVNVYIWGGEIPKHVVYQFEQETGIKVNLSTYDSNETMYAKLKANRQSTYDIILPSSYYVDRMKKQGLLMKLDHKKLPNLKNIDSWFEKNTYDENNHYSVPLIWGVTGIFYNQERVENPPETWSHLWQKRWRHKLLLLDDSREVFSLALMSLGYSPNDRDPKHIHEAYQALLKLIPNIKLFGSANIQSIMIDEESIGGITWNGDAYKAYLENNKIKFIYPKDGFVIWVDCLAIPANAPNPEAAYQFINFMLKPSSSAEITLKEGQAITNAKGMELLPKHVKNDPTIYPSKRTLQRGHFQRDLGDKTVALYNQYWEQLKLAF